MTELAVPEPVAGTVVKTGPLDHVNLHLVQTVQEAGEFMTWLGQSREVLGVDTETGGFSFHQDRLRMVQFGDLNDGWAIPWDRWGGVACEALNKYKGNLTLHNAPFDSRFIQHHAKAEHPETTGKGLVIDRWPWERTNDTMTMAHIVNPLRPKGLKPLGAMHVDPKAAQAQQMLDSAMVDNKWTWNTVPIDFPLYWIYGAMDPVLTCHIHKKFSPSMQSTYRNAYELEMGALRVVTNMMIKGARIDPEYCQRKMGELNDWVQIARLWLASAYGIKNATSNMQVIKALQDNGVELPNKRTKGGAQSLDKEVLEEIDHPIAKTVLGVRKCEKTVGPYFRNFLSMRDHEDLLHCTIWANGTRTSRMSITDPALQTLPRKDPLVRGGVIPRDGNSLITIDADQIEARLCAHFAQDEGMREAFSHKDIDFFVALACQIFQEDTMSKEDPRRQLTKNTTYGKIYGAGIDKMSQTAGVPYEQMASVVYAFDARFPGVKQLQNLINGTARQRYLEEGEAYIKTPYGRKLLADDDKEYTLTNYLIQGHAAEILKRNLIELDNAGLGEYLILPVHDEVVMDVPSEMASDALAIAEGIMNDYTNYFVPITWSGDILSRSWGEKYEQKAIAA
jgi:DNA polymerase I-like protein with 3'-5' exonuclease and polymerase domains